MSKKLTNWFPANVKPVRVGVYEVRPPGGIKARIFAFWNGKHWGYFSGLVAVALKTQTGTPQADQNKSWRGLASKP